MKDLYIATLVALIILATAAPSASDKGQQRLIKLRERSQEASKRIIQFSRQDFEEYAMQYPRPYDLVIYFTAKDCKLCVQLLPEYDYLVKMYDQQGAIDAPINPAFFVTMTYSKQIQDIFLMFGFKTAPNLVVSKPHMAVVSEIEKKLYLQKFKWSISYTDGHVTTHKMLQFVNKRTSKDIVYKPPLSTTLQMFFGFILVAGVGAFIYIKAKHIWTHWIFWMVGSLVIYITCCSGVIYDILHDVPFVGRDQKTGETTIFSDGNREQYGAEGLIISLSITFIGLLFISIVVAGKKLKERYSAILGLSAIVMIFWIVNQLEIVYKSKGWYGPNFYPPDGYLSGPLSRDQGNNI